MSTRRAHLPLARLDGWLPDLDHDALTRLVGREAAERARRDGLRLESQPVGLANQLVQARVADRDLQVHSASAGVGAEGELACHCSCSSELDAPPCDHVTGLLHALASSPDLRRQVLASAPWSSNGGAAPSAATPAPRDPPAPAHVLDRSRALALLREQGVDGETVRRRRSTGLLDATFQGWRRRGEIRPLGEITFFVKVVDGDPEELDPSPVLHVRAQPVGDRRPFGPDDLESRRLPAREWRLFEPLTRAPGVSKAFLARGAAAATFLERARATGVEVREDDGGPRIRLLETELRPALRLRESGARELREHPAIAARSAEAKETRARLTTAWQRYRAERGAIGLHDFLARLGIPEEPDEAAESAAAKPLLAIEACWVAAARSTDSDRERDRPQPVAWRDAVRFAGPQSWVFLRPDHTFAPVAQDVGPIALARLDAQPTVLLAPDELGRVPPLLREHFRSEGIELPARSDLGLPPLPVPRIVLRVQGSAFSVRAALEARYGDRVIALVPGGAADPDDVTRNAEVERAALDRIAATGLHYGAAARRRRASADTPPPPLEFTTEGDGAVAFWTRDLPRLVAASETGGGIDEVAVPPALRQLATRAPLRASLSARAARGGVIDVALRYAADGVPADIDEIRQALAAKRRWVRLTDGSVAELSERVASLAGTTRDVFRSSVTAELPRHAIGEIDAWRELTDEVELDRQIAGWSDRLRALPSASSGPIPGLRAELRAYQRAGVAWLQLLADLGAGGILADDMGLGKTVQALALLAWRRERDGPAPSLVVAPTSVALNWIREAERFVPDLRPLLLHGADRHERYEDVPQADVVVTTYALLRRDVERLRDIAFRYVILDEAQQIKNHAAATTAAAKSLRAEARLALTGTPIENRLLELWSILDFCNPGLLGSWRSFARRYERPVVEALEGNELAVAAGRDAAAAAEDGGSSAAAPQLLDEAAALRARIHPFVLRRTKADVQRDLPPKIESDVAVEMTPAQRRAYAALAAAMRADLGPKLSHDGLDRHRMLVLTALLRLRQMACDPRLVDPRHKPEDSAKLLAFRELTAEVIASGRRALVFSQFVELLALLRQDLKERGIEYCYLDGRTRDRQGVIESFSNGTQPLFLLSLRAGGTGINLAAADVVIHLDPWWNPAVEEQATDRAHRIGQVKTVSVYRIVAAGTVEEAILRMKQRKRALASAVITDSSTDLPQLSADDVEEMLQFDG